MSVLSEKFIEHLINTHVEFTPVGYSNHEDEDDVTYYNHEYIERDLSPGRENIKFFDATDPKIKKFNIPDYPSDMELEDDEEDVVYGETEHEEEPSKVRDEYEEEPSKVRDEYEEEPSYENIVFSGAVNLQNFDPNESNKDLFDDSNTTSRDLFDDSNTTSKDLFDDVVVEEESDEEALVAYEEEDVKYSAYDESSDEEIEFAGNHDFFNDLETFIIGDKDESIGTIIGDKDESDKDESDVKEISPDISFFTDLPQPEEEYVYDETIGDVVLKRSVIPKKEEEIKYDSEWIF